MGEVFDRYTDTVGNYHFTDTETGHHVISNESAIKELKWMLTDNSNTRAMYDALEMAIEALSEIRCGYNCFDDSERPFYEALSEAIEALQEQDDNPCENCQEFDCYGCEYKR